MVKCKICEKECTSIIKLQEHVSRCHKDLKLSEYYKVLDAEFDFDCPIKSKSCRGRKKFLGLVKGYAPTCGSIGCSTTYGMFKIYGVDNCSKLERVKEKKEQTCLRNYGVKNPSQSGEIKKSKKESSIANGYKDELEKARLEFEKSYGENPSKLEWVKEKKEQTCLRNYGVKNPSQSGEIKKRIRKSWELRGLQSISKLLECRKLELIGEYKVLSRLKYRCKICGYEFEGLVGNVVAGWSRCLKCYPRKRSSTGELEVGDFIKSLGLGIKINDRTIIKPLELDIVIEYKKLAVEYCGLYWHSNKCNVGSNYHLNKLEQCIKAGYKLITIFEDEWLLKQDIVKARLKHILGADTDIIKVRASACEIKEIDSKTKNAFLIQYHIQGKDNSSIRLGAYYNKILVAVMTFAKGSLAKGVKSQVQGVWELNRFCSNSSYHVYGIASKLLNYFKTNYDWNQIYSYADRRWSDGGLYLKLGFELVSTIGPNYWYWGNNIVGKAHRFNYRKSNLKHMSNYDPSLTEFQIMALEGYSWVYDCGNLKFKLGR